MLSYYFKLENTTIYSSEAVPTINKRNFTLKKFVYLLDLSGTVAEFLAPLFGHPLPEENRNSLQFGLLYGVYPFKHGAFFTKIKYIDHSAVPPRGPHTHYHLHLPIPPLR